MLSKIAKIIKPWELFDKNKCSHCLATSIKIAFLHQSLTVEIKMKSLITILEKEN